MNATKGNLSKFKRLIFSGLLGLFTIVLLLIAVLIFSVQITQRSVPEVDHYFKQEGTVYKTNYNRMVKQEFPVVKVANAFRIFVVGGSQAMGTPYVHQDVSLKFNWPGLPEGGGMVTWLEKYFTKLLPERKVEVINAAIGGEDIQTVAKVHKEILQIGHPDLIIILSGNNEFFRHYKNQSSYPGSSSVFSKKLQLLTNSYQSSLSRIVERSDSFTVRTYILTVPTNLRDWRPMSDGSFNEKKYKAMLKQGNYQEIIEQLENGRDTQNALRYFYLAKSYDNLGQYKKALLYYLLAKDHDYRFLRTHSNFNEMMRTLPSYEFVNVIDMESILRKYSKDGIPGFDLFHDWCHMKLTTNELVAREIAKYYKMESQIDTGLPESTLSTDYKRKAQILYYIKRLKWLRLKIFARDDALGEENIENVKEQYQKTE